MTMRHLTGPPAPAGGVVIDHLAKTITHHPVRCQSTKKEGARSWRCHLEANHNGPHRHNTGNRVWW